jgi:hypothetical protein
MFAGAIDPPAKQALGVVGKIATDHGFYLAGGTGAAIHLGHRLSVDLDFFSFENFVPEELERVLSGRNFVLANQQMSPGTLQGFYGGVNISFFFYPYPLLYPVLVFEEVNLAGLIDIGLMKMTAIASRGAKKDFVDLFFILQKLNQPVLFDEFVKKFPSDRIDLYHYARSLTFFEEAEKDPDPQMLVLWDWIQIKEFFLQYVKYLKF